jgi:hypothetical protein
MTVWPTADLEARFAAVHTVTGITTVIDLTIHQA